VRKSKGEDGEEEPGAGAAPTKTCPNCKSILFIAVLICPDCGFNFPTPESKIAHKASTLEIIQRKLREWVAIDRVTYHLHRKYEKPDSMRVTYHAGLLTYSEWVCIEHAGYPRRKAEQWWKRRSTIPCPATTAEALERIEQLAEPLRIEVERVDRYPEIMAYDFTA
jgi:DNA repair protein RadD